MTTGPSKQFLIVRQGQDGPAVHVFVDGREVAVVDLNARETLRLIGNLTDKLFDSV